MEKLNNLFRGTKLLLQYGLQNSLNRERISQTLKGEYKALHGIKGTIFLQGHMHSHPDVVNEIGSLVFRKQKDNPNTTKDKITAIINSGQIERSNVPYKEDMKIIRDLLGECQIEAIYIESVQKPISELLEGKTQKIFRENMKHMGFADDSIDTLELHQFGPVFFLWTRGVLKDVKIIGMEGAAKDRFMVAREQLKTKSNLLKQKINKYLADNKPIANHITMVLDHVVCNGRSFSDEGLQQYAHVLDSYLPREMKDEVFDLINSFRERFSEGSKQREIDMAQKIDSDGYKKAIAIVGSMHVPGLEKLLYSYHTKKPETAKK